MCKIRESGKLWYHKNKSKYSTVEKSKLETFVGNKKCPPRQLSTFQRSFSCKWNMYSKETGYFRSTIEVCTLVGFTVVAVRYFCPKHKASNSPIHIFNTSTSQLILTVQHFI